MKIIPANKDYSTYFICLGNPSQARQFKRKNTHLYEVGIFIRKAEKIAIALCF
jgi:hypothetical protein